MGMASESRGSRRAQSGRHARHAPSGLRGNGLRVVAPVVDTGHTGGSQEKDRWGAPKEGLGAAGRSRTWPSSRRSRRRARMG